MKIMNVSEKINSLLPPVERVAPQGEVDFYGFSHIIAQRLNLEKIPYSYGGWVHGWYFIRVEDVNHFMVNYDPKKFYFVATDADVNFLNSQGVYNVKAGGLPFVYADDIRDVERIPRSLLVMPGHFTAHALDTLTYARKDYIAYIKTFAGSFDHIVFCLNQECIRQGLWLKELKEANIPYVIGADSYDINSFARIRTIMSHFEVMTTNQMGSHVLYASLCGCKVSVAEEFSYIDVTSGDKHAAKTQKSCIEQTEISNLKKMYPKLYVGIEKAELDKEWAKEQAGVANILPSEEIAELLGWNNRRIQRYGKYAGTLAKCQKNQPLKRLYCHLMKKITGLGLPKKTKLDNSPNTMALGND